MTRPLKMTSAPALFLGSSTTLLLNSALANSLGGWQGPWGGGQGRGRRGRKPGAPHHASPTAGQEGTASGAGIRRVGRRAEACLDIKSLAGTMDGEAVPGGDEGLILHGRGHNPPTAGWVIKQVSQSHGLVEVKCRVRRGGAGRVGWRCSSRVRGVGRCPALLNPPGFTGHVPPVSTGPQEGGIWPGSTWVGFTARSSRDTAITTFSKRTGIQNCVRSERRHKANNQ